ncbi:hypothetical protein EYF80_060304 [Liparis tanakae]|uniref:Uncharacterized protein n=1 Tax=Liparis tanakae TaxID=230148 RepID=A0A4Z2ELD5_9TELE|nr:hypothetical protein EYF80_060304 [Liparis tanakae]
MEAHLHADELMDEAECLQGSQRELGLLDVLTETLRRLEAAGRRRDRHGGTRGGGEGTQRGSEGGMLSPAGDEEDEKDAEETRGHADEKREERESERRVLGVLRQLSVFHSDRVTAWREVLRARSHRSPPGGSDQQHPTTTGMRLSF